jgi:recombination protein RecA
VSKVLEAALEKINKDFDPGTIMRLGANHSMGVETFSTGSIELDIALGGGWPRGRIGEIYGPESSGKSTIATHIAASAQKAGGIVAYIDMEHAMDPVYAKAIGVDVDELLISQPATAQDALEIIRILVETGEVALIILDSVASLVPRQELEGEVGDSHVGLLARLMSQALRMLAGRAAKQNTSIIFINQLREKIGVMFGSPETQPGGRALKFYSSIRLDVRRKETLKDGDGEANRNLTKIKVVKNKVAPPYREAFIEIIFGEGISFASEVIDHAVSTGVITKRGSWHDYRPDDDDGLKEQSFEKARARLRNNPELLDEIYQKSWALATTGEVV